MRNLKKFLALVLAMMMVFGLMVTANASSLDDFTDADKIDSRYQQAVEIIAELGVLRGISEDVLGPTSGLTRAQMAAVLYRIDTGNVTTAQEDADNRLNIMKETQVFDDVAPGYWGTGYINYASANGWITGYTSTRFGPEDNLTVVQMLTVILRMLKMEDKTTGNWEMDTLTAAANAGLTGGFTPAELRGGATRQQVAQLSLTGMTKPTTKTTYYKITKLDEEFNTPEKKDGYTSFAEAMEAATATGTNGKYNDTFTIDSYEKDNPQSTLGYQTFKLVKDESGVDEYGRPATVYTVKGEVISSDTDDVVLERDMPITGAEMYDALGIGGKIVDAHIICADSSVTSFAGTLPTYETVTKNGSVNPTPYGGNGIHVEIYEVDDDQYEAFVTIPVFAKVSKVEEKAATAKEGAYTKYSLATSGVSGLDLREYTSEVSGTEFTNVVVDGTVKKDDYVLVEKVPGATAKEDCYILTPVDTVEGKVTGYASKTDTWTIGGDSYLASKVINNTGKNVEVSSTSRTVAVDGEGNVIGAVDEAAKDTVSYIFVLEGKRVASVENGKITYSIEVTGVNEDGEWITLPVGKVYTDNGANAEYNYTTGDAAENYSDDLFDDTGDSEHLKPVVYVYVASGSVYNLYAKDALSSATNATVKKADGTIIDTGITINGYGTLVDDTLYAGTNTKYYVAKTDGEGTYTGVTPYTGYAAINDVEDDIEDAYDSDGAAVYAIDANKDSVAEVVFIDEFEPTDDTENYAYILADYDVNSDGEYVYTAIINGVETELKLEEPLSITEPTLVTLTGGVTVAELSNTGTLEDQTANYINLNNEDTFTYNGGNLMKDKTDDAPVARICAIGANVPVYIFKDGKVTKTTASKLDGDGGPTIIFATDGSDIIAIYIVEDAEPSLNGATVSAGKKEVPSIKKDQTVVVTGGEVTITDSIEAEADVTADGFTSIKLGEGATCDEAVNLAEGKTGDAKTADNGMIFEGKGDQFVGKDGDSNAAYSDSNRHEISVTFTVPDAAVASSTAETKTVSVTIKLTNGTRVLTDTDTAVTAGKHFWLICPENLNDNDVESSSNNKFHEGTTFLTDAAENNTLEPGYWCVSVYLTADEAHPLVTGGFTVDEVEA